MLETDRQAPTSVYALTKMDQEIMALVLGRAYGIPTVALRYFNAYGPRQSLSNPYTGVCAIFMSRIKNDRPPVIYEDGLQTRDFVSVRDVAEANALAMERDDADYEVLNVGSGAPTTILDVARTFARRLDKAIEPDVTLKYRKGDIRHCWADTSKIRKLLGWEPAVSFEDGMAELIDWAHSAEAADRSDEAISELARRGLA
jgi:dTDP-L-rhamnose 4-epimerase